MQCDASDRGLGVVLSQVGEDGEEHPILYASQVDCQGGGVQCLRKGVRMSIMSGTEIVLLPVRSEVHFRDGSLSAYLATPNVKQKWALAPMESYPPRVQLFHPV